MVKASTLKCIICGKGIAENVSLYRINEKGVPGKWVCEEHHKQTDAKPIDENTKELVKAITGV